MMKFFLFLLFTLNLGAQTLPGQWRLPDGLQCNKASECYSNYCGVGPHGRKVCDTPGNFCYSRGNECLNDCECCSGKCASNGTCVADGQNECVPNNEAYRLSERECCSGKALSNGKCSPSQLSCQPLQERCLESSECCSKRCGSNGKCLPNSNAIFGGAPALLPELRGRTPASVMEIFNLPSK